MLDWWNGSSEWWGHSGYHDDGQFFGQHIPLVLAAGVVLYLAGAYAQRRPVRRLFGYGAGVAIFLLAIERKVGWDLFYHDGEWSDQPFNYLSAWLFLAICLAGASLQRRVHR